MNTSLALIQPSEFDLMSKLAKVAADSGYSGKNANQCLFVLLKGYELGISPFAALDGIQIIQGKPTVSPQLMLAMINRSGFLEDMTIESNATQCTVMMKRKGRSPHTETFTMNDAQAMQLAGKDNWKKQPATMLKWRAVSACARVVFPDVLMSVYTPEEMGADVSMSDDGEMTVITPAVPVIDVQPQVPALPENVIEYQDAHVDTVTGEKIVIDTDAAKEALGHPTSRVETTPETPAQNPLLPDWWNVAFPAIKKLPHFKGQGPHVANAFNALLKDGTLKRDMTHEQVIEIVTKLYSDDEQKKVS